MSVTFSTPATADYLNVSNGNYARLMALIGVEDAEWGGSYEGAALEALRARVAFTLESVQAMPALDGGTPTTETVGANGARIIDCGLSDGYFAHRLTALLTIIDAAIKAGEPVTFG